MFFVELWHFLCSPHRCGLVMTSIVLAVYIATGFRPTPITPNRRRSATITWPSWKGDDHPLHHYTRLYNSCFRPPFTPNFISWRFSTTPDVPSCLNIHFKVTLQKYITLKYRYSSFWHKSSRKKWIHYNNNSLRDSQEAPLQGASAYIHVNIHSNLM